VIILPFKTPSSGVICAEAEPLFSQSGNVKALYGRNGLVF
jgi:hypothetical protein